MSYLDAIQARINQMAEDLAKVTNACALPVTLTPIPATDTTQHTEADVDLTCTCGMRIVDIAEARRQGEQHESGTERYLHYNPTHRFYTKRDHPARPAHAHAE
ncbi:hypothetical protein Ait01nite_032030 [Actinoplanes italicus]|uniref:Uncharacterized protein n=1 Tax=Actinoplanes italicus TaxID=113567 RepID=A0A2T0KK13_9ACTN|nr:hypothetical protein [Actinoplanes italicus]PRX23656.1 hypothetical protein CLV67_103405 [Actinoplanes italicus]GIE30158.1 hypothetical protein Ait01nite_032030 [Actinoplanes italicus]